MSINTVAGNNYIKANAAMMEIHANNQLAMTQNQQAQLAFSKDAEAGALVKAGKDAIGKANDVIGAAVDGLAKGEYKNAADVQNHIDALKDGMGRVQSLSDKLKNAKGQKQRDEIKKDLKEETQKVKDHAKELEQKPKDTKAKEED